MIINNNVLDEVFREIQKRYSTFKFIHTLFIPGMESAISNSVTKGKLEESCTQRINELVLTKLIKGNGYGTR